MVSSQLLRITDNTILSKTVFAGDTDYNVCGIKLCLGVINDFDL